MKYIHCDISTNKSSSQCAIIDTIHWLQTNISYLVTVPQNKKTKQKEQQKTTEDDNKIT